MTSCLKTVRKGNSLLIYPVVSLIHVMKCTVLKVAVKANKLMFNTSKANALCIQRIFFPEIC